MRVSVVIPAYNEAKHIASCLRSLSAQKPIVPEIIVGDDGSTDGTPRIVEGFPVSLLRLSHSGAGAARNSGVEKTSGEILVFVDADMTFAPDFVEKLTAPILRGETMGTFTKDERVANWGNPWARAWNYNQNIGQPRRIPNNYPNEAPVFRAITAQAFKQAGGFATDVGYTDDWSLSSKLGRKAIAVHDATCYHANPESLAEVWAQARWIGGNEFLARKLSSLVRFSIPVSLCIGVLKAIYYQAPYFLLFKLVYDAAVFTSVIESFWARRVSK